MGAGGALRYRHLGRNSAHRKSLLRNLVSSLFTHEAINTTWPKAKEAQRVAEKLITLAKRNTQASRNKAGTFFYQPTNFIPRLFSTLRTRYANRPGGYTRVLRLEPLKDDQAPSALLELVDSPKDMRLALTAQTIARNRHLGKPTNEITQMNTKKVTQYREDGAEVLERLVQAAVVAEKEGVMGRRGEAPEKRVLHGPGRGPLYYPQGRQGVKAPGQRKVDTAGEYLGYNL